MTSLRTLRRHAERHADQAAERYRLAPKGTKLRRRIEMDAARAEALRVGRVAR